MLLQWNSTYFKLTHPYDYIDSITSQICIRIIWCMKIIKYWGPFCTEYIWTGPDIRHGISNLSTQPLPADISKVSCQKGPTHHAYTWRVGPFWQDTIDIPEPNDIVKMSTWINSSLPSHKELSLPPITPGSFYISITIKLITPGSNFNSLSLVLSAVPIPIHRPYHWCG